jgi:alkylated DNA repair dioxygenase AlkB
VVVLQDGFVHLVGFVPPDVQQRLIDEMREIGVANTGFFAEQFDGIKVSKDVQRTYLGMHWNAQAQRWDTSRSNLDGQAAAAIPKFLLDMYDDAVKKANREFRSGPNKKRCKPFPEGKAPTLAVVNFFQHSSTMQIHQDRTESKESIAAGYPVMGICIGDSCDLPYGTEQPTERQKPKTVRLESGDVYLFGSSSRMLWHGVSRVLPRSAPPSLRLIPGRLSVTLRVQSRIKEVLHHVIKFIHLTLWARVGTDDGRAVATDALADGPMLVH